MLWKWYGGLPLLSVERRNLDLWRSYYKFWRILVFGTGCSTYFAIGLLLWFNDLSIAFAGGIISGLIVVSLILLRNKIVSGYSVGKDFGRIYRMQVKAENLDIILAVAAFAGLSLFVYSLLSLNVGYFISGFLIIGIGTLIYCITSLFDTILAERDLAILCMRNFLLVSEADFCRIHGQQLARGLRQVERTFLEDGFRIPQHELALAVGLNRLTTDQRAVKQHIGSFVAFLENPQEAANVTQAIYSSLELLRNAKQFKEVGIEVPYPLRKRILSSSTLENLGYLAVVVSVTGPAVFYLLQKLGIIKQGNIAEGRACPSISWY